MRSHLGFAVASEGNSAFVRLSNEEGTVRRILLGPLPLGLEDEQCLHWLLITDKGQLHRVIQDRWEWQELLQRAKSLQCLLDPEPWVKTGHCTPAEVKHWGDPQVIAPWAESIRSGVEWVMEPLDAIWHELLKSRRLCPIMGQRLMAAAGKRVNPRSKEFAVQGMRTLPIGMLHGLACGWQDGWRDGVRAVLEGDSLVPVMNKRDIPWNVFRRMLRRHSDGRTLEDRFDHLDAWLLACYALKEMGPDRWPKDEAQEQPFADLVAMTDVPPFRSSDTPFRLALVQWCWSPVLTELTTLPDMLLKALRNMVQVGMPGAESTDEAQVQLMEALMAQVSGLGPLASTLVQELATQTGGWGCEDGGVEVCGRRLARRPGQ